MKRPPRSKRNKKPSTFSQSVENHSEPVKNNVKPVKERKIKPAKDNVKVVKFDEQQIEADKGNESKPPKLPKSSKKKSKIMANDEDPVLNKAVDSSSQPALKYVPPL